MFFYHQKLEKIIELLEQKPYWKSKTLAAKLKVSKSTIQRCLQELHDTGQAERIHGGVRRINSQISMPVSVDERIERDLEAKESICEKALELFPATGYVYIDAGTTTLPLAQKVDNVKYCRLTFVTNSASIAISLARRKPKHILLSGQVHPITQTISGPVAQSQICDYNFDVCFISADGIDSDYGVTCSLSDEALLKRQALKQSDRKVLLAASSKWKVHSGTLI